MEMAVNARDREQHGHGGLGLGLSLSLSIATAAPPPQQQRAISVAPISSHPAPPVPPQPQWWNGGAGLFFSPSSGMVDRSMERKLQQQPAVAAACHGHEMPFLRGIDVNRAPAAGESRRGCCSEDEEPAASSPNSTLSSLSGKRPAATRSGDLEGDHTPRAGGASDDEDSGAGGGSRKKLRLSKDQAAVLEESFKEHNTLNPKQKAALAKQLNLKPRQVEVWFQNRRASRTKLKQTEVDCEFLKRCCETLTEENRRLQREVAELRALKLVAPHQYARMPPPTTLTMCPSCERLATADEAGRAARPAAPTGPWGPVPVRPVFVDGMIIDADARPEHPNSGGPVVVEKKSW
ncbi:hypothetical protein SEVIR_9G327100v4 [Setaria viridis]